MKKSQLQQQIGLGVMLGFVACGLAVQPAKGEEGYEAGRGLITLEGPSGMFINPTSATLPENAGTAQYCVFFPDNKTDIVGHGLIGAYGLADNLEVGAQSTVIADENAKERFAAGPFVRYRFTKDEGNMPQLSVGAYSRLGDHELNKGAVFLAGYKRLPIAEDGFVRSLGIHAGIREVWLDDDDPGDEANSFAGYGGLELQFPARVYAVGEITSKDNDIDKHVPFAYGLQWRAAGIAMSVAGIQNGGTSDASFYYGIGYSANF